MRVAAYILAADPAWMRASVRSYYEAVDRIVVSYDENGRSWTGEPIAVDECLRVLKALDHDSKVDLAPGHFARLDHAPLDNDTFQRQQALDRASEGADWVLQLDTDEVVADLGVFSEALREAERRGFAALEFPARNLYQRVSEKRFLERSRRFWGPAGGYPGPVAVRGRAPLRLCRQVDLPTYRVDFSHRNTDPDHPASAPVHRVIKPSQGILHFSWVRSVDAMRAKARSSGHSPEFDWDAAIDRWLWCQRHPYLTTAMTPLRMKGRFSEVNWLRLVSLPAVVDGS